MVSGIAVQKSGGRYARYLKIGQYEEALWTGEAAARLGLQGRVVDEETFDALTSLKSPDTGEQLKPKHKQKITMWDLTFNASKSISLVSLFDPEVTRLHCESAADAMREEELMVPGRNLIYTQVLHRNSRLGDPQDHSHTAVINLTFNGDSEKWECVRQNFMNYWAQHQLTESYRGNLARSLIRKGYDIEDRPKQGFEIAGVPRELMQRFSRRSTALESLDEYRYRERSHIHKPPKQAYAQSPEEYLEWQREKLTQAERISLRQTVEKAYERSHKLRLRMDVAEGEEHTPSHRLTYGPRISM